VIAAICEWVEILADKAKLIEQSDKLRDKFKDVFDPLLHYDTHLDALDMYIYFSTHSSHQYLDSILDPKFDLHTILP